jgi:cytochrome c biogenesis protein CcdA
MALGLPRDLLRVTVLSAQRRVSLELVAITAAYALGATVPFVRAGCSATARWRCATRSWG